MELKEFIRTTILEYLNENVYRNKTRKVIFIDEHDKRIVYDDGNYRIAVDDENNAKYVTLWYKKYINEKEHWVKCGYLDSYKTRINFNGRNGDYLLIRSIEIEPKHRNKGYGTKMFKALFDFSGDNIKGVVSYLPNRSNKKQMSKIYDRFGAITDGDYQFIEFNN